MPKKEPLYPHVPKSRQTVPKLAQDKLRFLPDSPEILTQTVNATGYRAKLESVFRQAIRRAKGLK